MRNITWSLLICVFILLVGCSQPTSTNDKKQQEEFGIAVSTNGTEILTIDVNNVGQNPVVQIFLIFAPGLLARFGVEPHI